MRKLPQMRTDKCPGHSKCDLQFRFEVGSGQGEQSDGNRDIEESEMAAYLMFSKRAELAGRWLRLAMEWDKRREVLYTG